ncbi:MAG: AAA family ATPase [Oscillospiraceae bacterium]|nr:AAA family ATPase [Oscillospiraceae bacterium]
MNLQNLLSHLEGVRGSGGQYIAKCPAHDDQHQSLSVGEGKDGRLLVRCHAGCSATSVMEALGLKTADLFPEEETASRPADKWPEAEYIYPGGTVKKVKIRQADGGKFFYWQHLENGRWAKGRGSEAMLYCRRELDKEGLALLVEGEKDVDTLHDLGLCGVSLPDGAKSKWRPEYADALTGKICCILPDNDKPGREYAEMLASELSGRAESVKVIDLTALWPDMPEHGDVSDYLASGDLTERLKALMAQLSEAPEWKRPKRKSRSLPITDLESIEEKKLEFLIPDWLPSEGLVLLAAEGGVGKTSIWMEILSALSAGRPCMLDSPTVQRDPMVVAFSSAEDSVAGTLKAKFALYGANMKNIKTIQQAQAEEDGTMGRFKFNSPELEDTIAAIRPKLFVFDPIQSYMPKGVTMAARNDIRACLDPLHRLGERLGIAIILVCHTNKRVQAFGRDRIADSADLWDAARMVWMSGYTQDRDIRYLSVEKTNYSKKPDSILYKMDDSGLVVPVGRSPKHDEDFVKATSWGMGGGRSAPKREDCQRVLLDTLETRGGRLPTAELDETLSLAGFSNSTIKKAKAALKSQNQIAYCQTGSPQRGDKTHFIQLSMDDALENPFTGGYPYPT